MTREAALVLSALLIASCQPATVTPPPATRAATSPAATQPFPATATPAVPGSTARCSAARETYLTPDERPVVAPRKVGRFAELALDRVTVSETGPFGAATAWSVRVFNPADAQGAIVVPLRVSVRTSSGQDVQVKGYHAAPPNAGSGPAPDPLVVQPCLSGPGAGAVVLIVHTARITSGAYALTLAGITLPEGGTRDDLLFSVALTCAAGAGGGPAPAFSECR